MKPGDMVRVFLRQNNRRPDLLITGIYVGNDDYKGIITRKILVNGTGRMCYVPLKLDEHSKYETEVIYEYVPKEFQ